jgi:hypothetical protein
LLGQRCRRASGRHESACAGKMPQCKGGMLQGLVMRRLAHSPEAGRGVRPTALTAATSRAATATSGVVYRYTGEVRMPPHVRTGPDGDGRGGRVRRLR